MSYFVKLVQHSVKLVMENRITVLCVQKVSIFRIKNVLHHVHLTQDLIQLDIVCIVVKVVTSLLILILI